MRTKVGVSGLAFGVLSLLVSQAVAASQPLDIKGAELLAEKGAREAKQASLSLDTAKAKYDAAMAGYLPSLTASASLAANSMSSTLSLKQPLGQIVAPNLAIGGTSAISYKQATLDKQSADLDAIKANWELKFSVRTAYVNLLKARANLELAKEQLKKTKDSLLPETQAKFKAGVVTEVDVMKVESQVANAELNVWKSGNTVTQLETSLANYLGLAKSEDLSNYELSDVRTADGLSLLSEDVTNQSLDKLIALATARRTEVAKARTSLAQTNLSARRTQIENWPSLNLSARADSIQVGDGTTGSLQTSIGTKDMSLSSSLTLSQQSQAQSQQASSQTWRVGVDISAPILDWGQAKAEATQSKLSIQAAELALASAIDSVTTDVTSSYTAFDEAKRKLDVTAKDLRRSEASLKVTRARYGAGVCSISEVLDAELDAFSTRSSRMQAEYDLILAYDKLIKAIGPELETIREGSAQ